MQFNTGGVNVEKFIPSTPKLAAKLTYSQKMYYFFKKTNTQKVQHLHLRLACSMPAAYLQHAQDF